MTFGPFFHTIFFRDLIYISTMSKKYLEPTILSGRCYATKKLFAKKADFSREIMYRIDGLTGTLLFSELWNQKSEKDI